MKNSDGVKGHCYFCNGCHHSFWKSMDGTIAAKKTLILGIDLSKED